MTSFRREALFLAIAILAVSILPAQGANAQGFSKGDVWVYSVVDTSSVMTLEGTATTSYVGMGSVTVNGTVFKVYIIDFNTSLEGNDSGTNTEIKVSERAYYTVSNLDLVKDDYWGNLTQVNLSSGSIVGDVQTHNVTTIFPPGGFGSWPSTLTLGETWTIAYPTSSTETRGGSGGSGTITSFFNETVVYTYDGTESVTVPAGTFSCLVLNESSSDSTQTLWQSDVAGSQARIVQRSNSGETTTWELVEYSYMKGASRTPVAYYAIGASVAVLAVAIVALMLWRQRKKQNPVEEGPSQTGIHPDVPRDPWRPLQ